MGRSKAAELANVARRTARISNVQPGCTVPGNSQTSSSRMRSEKSLTGERELSELIDFKVYRSQLPVIEQALEIAGRMLGTDKSRGYCLEMICADFLAGAQSNVDPEAA